MPLDIPALRKEVERLYALPTQDLPADAGKVFHELRDLLSAGKVRAALPVEGGWEPQAWIKQGILVGFRLGHVTEIPSGVESPFLDKHNLPLRRLGLADQVRVVPGGSAVRDGAYLGKGVVCMPPMYVNIGAYVDDASMIDSHALVGSCAQVGRRVHLSAAAQIGGVLEPVGAMPVIVEDDVLVGGLCGIFEGTIVGKGAVLAAGSVLTRSTRVFDLVHERVIAGSAEQPLIIPPGAVVVPGSRPARGGFATQHGLQLHTPVIVKYRDAGTDAAVALEDALR